MISDAASSHESRITSPPPTKCTISTLSPSPSPVDTHSLRRTSFRFTSMASLSDLSPSISRRPAMWVPSISRVSSPLTVIFNSAPTKRILRKSAAPRLPKPYDLRINCLSSPRPRFDCASITIAAVPAVNDGIERLKLATPSLADRPI